MTGDQHMSLGVHQGNKAAGAVQKSPVQDKVLAWSHLRFGWGSLSQAVIYHTVKLSRAVSALVRQLSDRITFDNPVLKPAQLPGVSCGMIMPAIGVTTRGAKPTLSSIRISSVSLENPVTMRTMFFWPYILSSLNQFNNCNFILCPNQS